MDDLLAELERLHSRADEARRKAAKSAAAAEHKRAELTEISNTLKNQYGIESWEQASEWLVQLGTEAEQAVAHARELIETEGIGSD